MKVNVVRKNVSAVSPQRDEILEALEEIGVEISNGVSGRDV